MPEITPLPDGPDPLDRSDALESAVSSLRWYLSRVPNEAVEVMVPLADLRVLLSTAVVRAERGGSCFLPGEPSFVIRAKDNRAILALGHLRNVYPIEPRVTQRFLDWRQDNEKACKDPD